MINTWRPAVYTQKGAGRNWFLDLADLFKEHDEYTKNQLDQLILDPVPDPFAYFIPRSESQIKRRGEREKRRRKKKEKITRRDSDDPLFVPRGKADKWRRYRVTRHTNTNPKKLHLARSYEAGIRERSNQLLVTQALVFSCCCLVRQFLIPELSYCEAPSLSLSLSLRPRFATLPFFVYSFFFLFYPVWSFFLFFFHFWCRCRFIHSRKCVYVHTRAVSKVSMYILHRLVLSFP